MERRLKDFTLTLTESIAVQSFKVAVKIKAADVKRTIAFINSTWDKFSPGFPLDYKFMDESYGLMYKSEEKLSDLLWIFAIMAIVVGCMEKTESKIVSPMN